ncbi:MAG: hypothetical protein AB7T06_27795 [Kofleriaceae bacterium]
MKVGLPYPVLLVSAREEAARRLGVSVADVISIAYGRHAYRDGELFDADTFRKAFPDDEFEAFTAAQAFPAELMVKELDVQRDPSQRLEPPISAADVAAVDAVARAAYVARLTELDAPGIILREARSQLQQASETGERHARWEPVAELVTGNAPASGAAGEPRAAYALPFSDESFETAPRDCAFVGSGFLLQYRYASLVIGLEGEIRDVFPTCASRAVGSDARHVLLVTGGGGASDSGYFDGEAYVRDVAEHRWLVDEIPQSLPRFIAGTIGDMKWAVVVDVVAGVGYRTAPHTAGDQCGGTFNSACTRYVWDGARFVLEAATGEPVLDARAISGTLVSFAKTATGWRFIVLADADRDPYEEDEKPSQLRIVDESGACIRELGEFDYATAVALSADGTRMLHATMDNLRIVDADTGRLVGPAIDLRPLHTALALPNENDLWRRLTASVAIPSAVARMSVEQARDAIEATWSDTPEDAEISAVLAEAASAPELPRSLPHS